MIRVALTAFVVLTLASITSYSDNNQASTPRQCQSSQPVTTFQISPKKIVIAVVDSGVDFSHPLFKGHVWTNLKEIPGNGVDDDGNGFVDDINGWNFVENNNNPAPSKNVVNAYHGTHVAGVIPQAVQALTQSQSRPIFEIMAVKFLDDNKQGSTLKAIHSIRYAVQQGAQIINLSWGSYKYNELLKAELESAKKAGVLVVTAAGNDNTDIDEKPFFPASYNFENILTVTGADDYGRLVKGLNYGLRGVDIAAPGFKIRSADWSGGFRHRTGSSIAAPYVSAAAALEWSTRPSLTSLQVKNRVISNCHRHVASRSVLALRPTHFGNATTDMAPRSISLNQVLSN